MINKMRWVFKFIRKNGILCLVQHIFFVIIHAEEKDYNWWRKKHTLTKRVLKKQNMLSFQIQPVISILLPLRCAEKKYIKKMIKSIQLQTYFNWELCISDGSGSNNSEKYIFSYVAKNDNRVKLVTSERELSDAENLNSALKIATGDYIALSGEGDLLENNALYECIKIINQYPKTDIIYTDEDIIDKEGKKFFCPHFKSDFNLDLLRSMNYIDHLFVVKKDIQQQVGMFSEYFYREYEYDFILKCIEKSKNIYHIPKVLYHKRNIKKKVPKSSINEHILADEKVEVVKLHLERSQVAGKVSFVDGYNLCKVEYTLKAPPLISILIPNRDHIKDLERCVLSLYEVSEYTNFEIIIIENGSVDKKTFNYYKSLTEKYENVKIIIWKGNKEFNYSALNNFGVKYAIGEYLLFLNNDTEIINKNCISEMISNAVREEVGAVGAKLLYPDGSIQHAGVILGLGGIAGHAFREYRHNAKGYFSRIFCKQNYSAVTAACLLMSKELFNEIGGFDENLKVAFNDVDLCMKIRSLGKLIVYTPYAELYHFESKSRGKEDTEEKQSRFHGEVEYFKAKWKKELEMGDPYYNPNLSLEKNDFSIRVV
jgi:GT2 family glycosyltransferase